MLCLVRLQNVKFEKKVKVQTGGVQKYRLCVPTIRLKLTRDEDAEFFTLVSKFKILPSHLRASATTSVQKIILLLPKSNEKKTPIDVLHIRASCSWCKLMQALLPQTSQGA